MSSSGICRVCARSFAAPRRGIALLYENTRVDDPNNRTDCEYKYKSLAGREDVVLRLVSLGIETDG